MCGGRIFYPYFVQLPILPNGRPVLQAVAAPSAAASSCQPHLGSESRALRSSPALLQPQIWPSHLPHYTAPAPAPRIHFYLSSSLVSFLWRSF